MENRSVPVYCSQAVGWLAAPLRDIHINIQCYILMEVEHDSLLFRKNADDTKIDKKRPCPRRPLHIRRFQADSIPFSIPIKGKFQNLSTYVMIGRLLWRTLQKGQQYLCLCVHSECKSFNLPFITKGGKFSNCPLKYCDILLFETVKTIKVVSGFI